MNCRFCDWICKGCNIKLRTRKELNSHKKNCSQFQDLKGNQPRINCICEFCGKEWITTKSGFKCHIRYCLDNPNKVSFKVYHHSEDTRKIISESRKQTIIKQGCEQNLKHRSYIYNGNVFSSSYEVKYALYCEEHNIKYIVHPSTLKYIFNQEEHLYFPDFYLPLENKYVDPKNTYLIKHPQKHLGISDSEKIKIVSEQNEVIIEIIDGKDIICDNNKLQEILACNKSTRFENTDISPYKRKNTKKSCCKQKDLELLKSNGQIDKLGRLNKSVTPEPVWLKYKELILCSGVDLNIFGWVTKVSEITGLTRKQIRRTVRRYKIPCLERRSAKPDNF